MEIIVSEEAVAWYKKELEIKQHTALRLFVRYGGFGGHIPGFSLGINLEQPNRVHASTEVDGITFYVEEDDAWYFEDKDLIVSFNTEMGEPQFTYQ